MLRCVIFVAYGAVWPLLLCSQHAPYSAELHDKLAELWRVLSEVREAQDAQDVRHVAAAAGDSISEEDHAEPYDGSAHWPTDAVLAFEHSAPFVRTDAGAPLHTKDDVLSKYRDVLKAFK